MSLERLRNVATELSGELTSPDIGYRLVKIDSTNMSNVTREPDATDQLVLGELERSVKRDRSSEDVLFQVMLDWGLELTMPIQKEKANGFDIYNVEEGALMMCVKSRENSSLSLSLSLFSSHCDRRSQAASRCVPRRGFRGRCGTHQRRADLPRKVAIDRGQGAVDAYYGNGLPSWQNKFAGHSALRLVVQHD